MTKRILFKGVHISEKRIIKFQVHDATGKVMKTFATRAQGSRLGSTGISKP